MAVPSTILLLFTLGCASAQPAPEPARDGAEPTGGAKSGPTEQELESARTKVQVAELELALAQKTREEEQAHKAKELELAKGELTQFDEVDSPTRLAQERLSLTRSKDSLAEQEEELAQLEMTYAEVDLADKTREIVLRRNHRRVERAKESLALEEREFAKLEQHILPRERARLALGIEEKSHALENAQRSAEIGLLSKKMALVEARAALAKLEKGEAGKAP
jgi:small-conductance mechanosensitive channel